MSTAVGQTTRINTPAIIDTEGVALAANPERLGWSIQNVGTAKIYVRLGGTASSTVFDYVLKGGSGNSDGLGAMVGENAGTVYTGIITVAGSSPLFVVMEH